MRPVYGFVVLLILGLVFVAGRGNKDGLGQLPAKAVPGPGQSAAAFDTSADADFAARCSQPSVINCFAFDSEIPWGEYMDPGLDPAAPSRRDTARIDRSLKASGSGSLQFIIPARAPANSSGQFHMNFSRLLKKSFGEGDEFFVQWRQRFDRNYLTNRYLIGSSCRKNDSAPQLTPADCPGDDYYGGMKQAIIGPQDTDMGSSQFGKHWSCETPHVVITAEGYNHAPLMYHSCGAYEDFKPLYMKPDGGWSYLSEGALPCDFRAISLPNGSPPPDPCARFLPDQWMTLQVHVRVGRWYTSPGTANKHRDSLVEMWLAQEGQASVLVQSQVMYDLRNDTTSTAMQPGAPYKYGKIWFLPYNTNRDPNAGPYPVANTWYDELIISTRRIPDPSIKTPNPPDNLAAVALNDRVANNRTTVKLAWRRNVNVNENADEDTFHIERCPGQLYDCLAGNLAKLSWTHITAVPAGTETYVDASAAYGQMYSYRVRALNRYGASAYSSAAINLPAPPSDLSVAPKSGPTAQLRWLNNADDATEFVVERCEGLFEYYKHNGTAAQSWFHSKCLNAPLEEGGAEANNFVEIARVSARMGKGMWATFEDASVKSGKTYSYRVRALNPAGTVRNWDSGSLAYTGNVNVKLP